MVRLAAGPGNSCLIDSMFDLKCWGMDDEGQNRVPEWKKANEKVKWEGVSLGFKHSCGLDKGYEL